MDFFVHLSGNLLFRQVSPNTDQRLRSLLQKAVRRGYTSLAWRVALDLQQLGDRAWLRQRIPVIVYEECWPLAANIKFPLKLPDAFRYLATVARSEKAKDAAGLGSLAYACSQGDTSIQAEPGIDSQALRTVAKAIEEPEKFWAWLEPQCERENQSIFVSVTRQAHRKGGWPWDRAFMLAAAFLAVNDSIPEIKTSTEEPSEEFPYWIALDKHTPDGKNAIRQAAEAFNLPANQLMWANFYCESALTNKCIESPWWNAERRWRLGKAGLTVDRAFSLWERVRPSVEAILAEESERLRTTFTIRGESQETPLNGEEPPIFRQLDLF